MSSDNSSAIAALEIGGLEKAKRTKSALHYELVIIPLVVLAIVIPKLNGPDGPFVRLRAVHKTANLDVELPAECKAV